MRRWNNAGNPGTRFTTCRDTSSEPQHMPLSDCNEDDIRLIGDAVGVPANVTDRELWSSLRTLELIGLRRIEIQRNRVLLSLLEHTQRTLTLPRRSVPRSRKTGSAS